MDTSDGFDYAGLDFVLYEPGMIEDTRIEEQAALTASDDIDAPLRESFRAFDSTRNTGNPAVACLIRVQGGEFDDEAVFAKLAGSLRSADRCLRDSHGDYALALADCDVEMARKRITLMMRLAHIEAEPAEGQASFCAGISPVANECVESLRTARVACELAAFQAPGHIEVIEI